MNARGGWRLRWNQRGLNAMKGELSVREGILAEDSKKMEQVFHGNLIGNSCAECFNCDLFEVAKFVHQVLTSSDNDFQDSLDTKDCSRCYKGLVKRVSPVSSSCSIQKVLKKAVKRCAALSVELNPGNSPRNGSSWDKFFADHLPAIIVVWAAQEAKIMFKRDLIKLIGGFKLNPKPCLDTNHASLREERVPGVNEITSCTFQRVEEVSRDDSAYLKDSVIYKAKVTFRSISVIRRELPESELGWPLLPRTNRSALDTLRNSEVGNMSLVERNSNETKIPFNLKTDYSIVNECKIEGTVIQLFHTSENRSRDGSSNGEDARFGFKQEVSSHPDHVLTKNSTRSGPGWPLLRVKTSASLESFQESQAEKFSVAQWASSLTDRSEDATTKFQIDFVSKEVESYVENKMRGYKDKNMGACLASKLPKKMDCVYRVCTSGCKQFGYEELKRATHQFSSENFVGEGGCSNVYKGYLPGGKQVAVKILKQYKEAWSDFSLEIDIMSSLKHKHITPLIGICVEDNHLILVYDFLSQGSLDERLQGKRRKSVLPWKVRFKVAIAIAEALNHLHNECSRPVIHRDVKSSNILLSKDFQPQLSDFGLAIWGPADSAYAIHSDVVGTFGYIAPEYFMNGRVSDKIDVYSFGIVLLELLTGKKPIISKDLKGQECLIKWATPLLESGNLKALLDPKTNGNFDVVQMQRMVLAATLCVRQTDRLRPKVSQILELLRGEKDEGEWVNSYGNDLKKSSDEEPDDLFLDFGSKPGLETSFLQLNDDDASHSSVDTASLSRVDVTTPSRAGRKSRSMLRDYLKESQG
ncbi:PREDICTED: inactive protein kinase SELMODRAFT_444075-like [Populus euphratica]|uniref:Inactive protein kinase SELMODRAFT_444075-like n=1 Tax=Populus euphratica TaxID=75702 RepID=A0AAJ6XXV1_POPEU|nr:PREDICTED: inactive protein kinase SELMODRAFT_444075-like [Populus euphratica]